ncbi:MAG: type III pantothenate kinase [candidate division Zixibacteria bacterium]|nr:type III pantothenate kinase [candidate division Zixibacteria bacterium]MDH3936254.1 type III pantothenate kinase [candidate division Zixibacteria bacterium]MDH4034910.1 type III pantothenate kinase [candidate division Zixibacteria bacterium]
MILVIDIGNSNIVIGLYAGEKLEGSIRLTTRDSLTSDEAGLLVTGFLSRKEFDPDKFDQVVIGSVVPHLTSAFEETVRKYLGCDPVVVSADLNLPVTIDIDRPHQAGADRIANAAAGFTRWGGPLIVVDFGTATTFDIVNSDGAYIGGVISPGHKTSMAQLVRRTAQLPEVRIEPPSQVVGRDTETALMSGLFHGTVGQVDHIIDKIIEETGMVDPTIIATGGLATGIEMHSRHIQKVDLDLTLDGLRIIGQMNK